ncbi:MAG: nicotinate-nucleotide adenylyltransferase [Actinomycetota bacterium]|nr:nicotinate-nucleotide adenylyltransferase [Actinomycetota bacterium]
MRRAAFPGSFNPLTVAHLAMASAAVAACGVDGVDLVVSRVALGKEAVERPRLEERLAVLTAAAATRPWLGVVVTDAQLLVDVARGYDALVLGADKWAQVLDPAFYGGSVAARDAAVASLPPTLAVAPRGSAPLPDGAVVLAIDPGHDGVSSSGARAGAHHWMAEEAVELDRACGAWTDPDRYEAWLRLQ